MSDTQTNTKKTLKVAFSHSEEAKKAQQEIQSSGLSPESTTLTTQNFVPRPPIQKTQSIDSAKGAAIIGTVLGGLTALSLGIVNLFYPENGPLTVNSHASFIIGITLLGMLVGAAGFGLIGAISGRAVPKSSFPQEPSKNYLLTVTGTEEEIQTVSQILQKKEGQSASLYSDSSFE